MQSSICPYPRNVPVHHRRRPNSAVERWLRAKNQHRNLLSCSVFMFLSSQDILLTSPRTQTSLFFPFLFMSAVTFKVCGIGLLDKARQLSMLRRRTDCRREGRSLPLRANFSIIGLRNSPSPGWFPPSSLHITHPIPFYNCLLSTTPNPASDWAICELRNSNGRMPDHKLHSYSLWHSDRQKIGQVSIRSRHARIASKLSNS